MSISNRIGLGSGIAVLTGALAIASSISGFANAADVTLRFATIQSPRHELSLRLQDAFERIEKETDGRVEFEVHYGSESGFQAKQYVSALEYGMLDSALIPTSASALEYPWLGVYGLPFLSPDADAREPMLAATKPMLEEFSGEHHIVPLAYPLHPDKWLVIYLKNGVKSVDDFSGKLVRTYDPNTNAIVTALGAVPTSLQKSEIYMGLQRGTIDGAITGITALKEMKFNEVVDNVYQLDLMFLPHILGVSEQAWQRLDAKDQEIVRAVFAEWDKAYMADLSNPDASGDPYAYANEHGVKIIVPDEAAKQVFSKIHEDAVAEFVAQDDMSKKAYDAIDAVRASASN